MYCSDTMGNKGAYITLEAPDLVPQFTSYDAVVSFSTPNTDNLIQYWESIVFTKHIQVYCTV